MSLISNLNILLKSLDMGVEVKLASGHTLVIPEDHEEPGFLMDRTSDTGVHDKVVMMIGSSQAWMGLIEHAKSIDHKEINLLCANSALTSMKRDRIAEINKSDLSRGKANVQR